MEKRILSPRPYGALIIALLCAIAPLPLLAQTIVIPVTQASWHTGTVFSDFTGWGSSTAFIRVGQTTSYGGLVSGGWARFDISAIPVGSTINSVELNFNVFQFDGTGPYVDFVEMSSDPVSASFQTIWNDLHNGTIYFNDVFIDQLGDYFGNLPSSGVQDLEQQLSAGWFAVGFTFDDVQGFYAYIRGWDHADRPYLVVDYTPPGDIFEPDNTPAEASFQALNSTSLDHSIVPEDDVDWIYFVLNETSHVDIETNGASGGDTRMWLYDASIDLIRNKIRMG